MREITCGDEAAFIRTVHEHGVQVVIMAVADEYGPRPPDDQQQANYSADPMLTLLAYDQGDLIRAQILDADLDGVSQRLQEAGLTVHRRSRNERTWKEG